MSGECELGAQERLLSIVGLSQSQIDYWMNVAPDGVCHLRWATIGNLAMKAMLNPLGITAPEREACQRAMATYPFLGGSSNGEVRGSG